MALANAEALGRQTRLEPRIALHLHLQQHHRKPRTAGLRDTRAIPRPQHAVVTMAHLLLLQRLAAARLPRR